MFEVGLPTNRRQLREAHIAAILGQDRNLIDLNHVDAMLDAENDNIAGQFGVLLGHTQNAHSYQPRGHMMPQAGQVVPPLGQNRNIVIGHPSQAVQAVDGIQVLPLPANQVRPLPANQVPTLPANQSLPLPANQVMPLPANQSLPLPANQVLPLPANQVLPLPANQVLPLTANQVLPLPANQVLPLPLQAAEELEPQDEVMNDESGDPPRADDRAHRHDLRNAERQVVQDGPALHPAGKP
ncbi:hypothetical protein QAD02_000445 [Eretmocerus hayati]|uniref:Uncharacterized protein n=1 Tax=Eretmocerus hayati TaxID=131215 RepID=A0ACC2NDM6_9HYME|nr:hypothetical protein QAD02_000445 [Eretmocerus hayati]